jgi:antirestriction protein ArdC
LQYATALFNLLARREKPLAYAKNSNEEIREEVNDLTQRLESGIQDLYASDKYAAYLSTLSKFHHYSLRNTILIHLQMPNASQVAGFNTWKKEFGRSVMKGQKGIRILAPAPFVVKQEMDKLDPDTKTPMLDETGKAITEEVEITIPHFRPVSVFDVSQTDGPPLSMLAEDLTGNVRQYEAFMDALKAVSAMPIVFETLPPHIDGECRFESRTIAIREGMGEIQTVGAVIHEMTHAELHEYNSELDEQEAENDDTEDNASAPRSRRAEEVEAESVSYVVCQHYGIETGKNSFGYIADWSRGKELAELKASLDIIRKTAVSMIDRIDKKFAEICKERGIDLVTEQADVEAPPIATTDAPAPPQPEKQYELGYGHMGNGLTVWNRLEEKNGDYVTVAHIGPDRSVTFYDDNMPDSVKAQIEETARTADMSVSATKDAAVFSTPVQAVPAAEIRPIGTNVLMTPVFDGGNFNRSGKKIRVTVVEPAGKYQLFSHDAGGEKTLYFLTASGRVDRTSWHFQSVWDGQQNKYVDHIPTEAEFDEVLPVIAAQFERDMENPEMWVKYQHAAVMNRLDDCDAHNAPIRIRRDEEYSRRKLEGEQARQEEQRQKLQKYDARVDEIAKAIEQGKSISVAYSEYEFDGKNPVLDLFKLYDVALPLRTQGWVNTGLAEISEGSYRYFSSKHKGDSTTFNQYFAQLREAIKETPIEQKRQPVELPQPELGLPAPAPQTMKPEQPTEPLPGELPPDPTVSASALLEYGYTQEDMYPLSRDRALELFNADHTIYMIYADNTEMVAFERDEIITFSSEGLCGITKADWEMSPFYAAQKEAAVAIGATEDATPAHDTENTYEIYQLKGGDKTRDYRFESLAKLEVRGLTVDRANYELVYTAPLAPGDTPDSLYQKFNTDHPADFRGHSLSMSDVIVLRKDGETTSHYIDSTEIAVLPAFLGNEKEPELAVIIPPPTTGPTVAELEAQVKAGQSISLLDLAGAVHREQPQAPRQKASTKAKGKSSILANLRQAQRELEQGRKQQDNTQNKSSNREV